MANAPPRVLFVDIETSPHLGHFWDLWETNPVNIVQESHLLSFAYKFDSSPVKVLALPDFPLYKRNKWDDKQLIKALWKVMNEATVIVAHNGDAFDIKKANARFIKHGLNPPEPYKTIDTLKIARRVAAFPSNKLDSLAKDLNIGRKLPHTGIHLWLGCMNGDRESWKVMKQYNAHDVELLYQVYLKLRPWGTNKTYDQGCPACSSFEVHRRGVHVTRTRKQQRWQCQECGYWFLEGIIKGDKIKRT